MTGHGNRAASASAGVALAALLLTACVSEVRLAPDDPSWTVAGGAATWTAEPVTVVVHLDTDVVDFPARGEIVNRGAAPVRVTFVPAADTAAGGAGRMGGTAEGLPSPLSAGTPYDVPAGRDGEPGVLEFALRADEPWTDLPDVGARTSWTIVVVSQSAETRCPFRFSVASASRSLSTAGKVAVGVALAGVVVWAVAAAVHDVKEDWNFSISFPAPRR